MRKFLRCDGNPSNKVNMYMRTHLNDAIKSKFESKIKRRELHFLHSSNDIKTFTFTSTATTTKLSLLFV